MRKHDPMTFLIAVALLTSVVAAAEEPHPSGYEPALLFEDEIVRAIYPRTPPTPVKIAEPAASPEAPDKPALTVERPVPVAAPSPQSVSARPEIASSTGAWQEIGASNYPVGLTVLALAGYVFWNIRRTNGRDPDIGRHSPGTPDRHAGYGKTGVTLYLERKKDLTD